MAAYQVDPDTWRDMLVCTLDLEADRAPDQTRCEFGSKRAPRDHGASNGYADLPRSLEINMENSDQIVAAILAHALIARLGREPDAKIAVAVWREVLTAIKAIEPREIGGR
jgi:hypothetical protein